MAYTVGMVSLGCAKNQVDGEVLMASLKNAGFLPVDDAALADIAIVNTCGFIESAKRESIEEILELAALKKEGKIKKLVITGCLSERYQKEMHQELPEADAVLGIGANGDIAPLLTKMMEENTYVESFPDKARMPLCGDRELTTPSYFAYVKIAEGCDNRCSYCLIPSIRGRFRSRAPEDIIAEAEKLASYGYREVILVAQDLTRYGQDIPGWNLARLLTELVKIDGIDWIRLHYLYPHELTDELIDVIACEDKVVKYLDVPLQHINAGILRKMNRRDTPEEIRALITKLRERIPGLVLRTSLITGLPGEGEEEFAELCDFLREYRIERAGVFPFSPEEGTPAAKMPHVDGETARERAMQIQQLQAGIMDEWESSLAGRVIDAVCDGYDPETGVPMGRAYFDSPGIDGMMEFVGEISPGDIARVEILSAEDGVLKGRVI